MLDALKYLLIAFVTASLAGCQTTNSRSNGSQTASIVSNSTTLDQLRVPQLCSRDARNKAFAATEREMGILPPPATIEEAQKQTHAERIADRGKSIAIRQKFTATLRRAKKAGCKYEPHNGSPEIKSFDDDIAQWSDLTDDAIELRSEAVRRAQKEAQIKQNANNNSGQVAGALLGAAILGTTIANSSNQSRNTSGSGSGYGCREIDATCIPSDPAYQQCVAAPICQY